MLQNRSCWCADSSPGMLPQVSTAWTVPDLRAERDGVHPTVGPRRRLSEKPQERKWDLAWPLGGKSLTSNPSPEAHAAGETSWFCSLDGWGLRPSWAQVWPLPPPKNTAAPPPQPSAGSSQHRVINSRKSQLPVLAPSLRNSR